jgi:hypothetical protein
MMYGTESQLIDSPPLYMSTCSFFSLVLHYTCQTFYVEEVVGQGGNMTAQMQPTAQMLQEIECGTAAEVSITM